MSTIQQYRQISDEKVISYKVKCSIEYIEKVFKRYVKSYMLAYGKTPDFHSLLHEHTQYEGVTLEQLQKWREEVS